MTPAGKSLWSARSENFLATQSGGKAVCQLRALIATEFVFSNVGNREENLGASLLIYTREVVWGKLVEAIERYLDR